MRELIEHEILTLLEEKRDVLTERLSARLLERAGGRMDRAQQAAQDGFMDVERLLCNHTEAL